METIYITGMLDSDADVTVISHIFCPSDWDLVAPTDSPTHFVTVCLRSAFIINITGPGGRAATLSFCCSESSQHLGERCLVSMGSKTGSVPVMETMSKSAILKLNRKT